MVPVITFPNKSITFRRRGVTLGARITPKGPIQYDIVHGVAGTENDEQCHIVGGLLKLWRPNLTPAERDKISPSLPTTCLVKASSPQSDAVKPQQASIHIGYPIFDVHVDPVDPVDWSEHKTVTVRVHEYSGAAYYLTLSLSDECSSPAPDGPMAPGALHLDIPVTLANPGNTSYTCNMTAFAGPQDISGGGRESAKFTITVNP